MSPELKTLYQSYPNDLAASVWSSHTFPKGPWKIGFVGYPSVNEYFTNRLASLQTEFAAAKSQGLVTGSLLTGIPDSYSSFTPEFQVSAIEQMLRQGVNLIIMEPASDALATEIDKAGAAGVPVLLGDDLMPTSKYAVPLFTENFVEAEAGLLGLMKKGNLLIVRGQQGSMVDTMVNDQVMADLKNCPDIHVVGTVFGQYATATAKTAVQQYIAAHPGQKIDGVVDGGGMFAGIAEAFQASGATVPPMSNTEPTGGELSYWLANKDTYKEVAQGITGQQAGYTWFNTALKLLNNQQPKLNVLAFQAPVITNDNLANFAPVGSQLADPNEIIGAKTAYCDDSCISKYFNTPGGLSVP